MLNKIKVTEILNKIETVFGVSLPNEGFLAGQSVSSAIIELIGMDINPVYNDIDIFSFYRGSLNKKGHNDNKIKFKDSVCGYSCNEYKELDSLYLKDARNYQISDTSRNGFFNFINMHIIHGELTPIMFLSHFDINTTQVGVDLTTKKIYSTKNFKDFLRTKKILVSSFLSPNHTAVRLFKKRIELFPHLTDDYISRDVLKLATLMRCEDSFFGLNKESTLNKNYFPFFGEKMFLDFEKNEGLKKTFDLMPHETNPIYFLNPNIKDKSIEVIKSHTQFHSTLRESYKTYNDSSDINFSFFLKNYNNYFRILENKEKREYFHFNFKKNELNKIFTLKGMNEMSESKIESLYPEMPFLVKIKKYNPPLLKSSNLLDYIGECRKQIRDKVKISIGDDYKGSEIRNISLDKLIEFKLPIESLIKFKFYEFMNKNHHSLIYFYVNNDKIIYLKTPKKEIRAAQESRLRKELKACIGKIKIKAWFLKKNQIE